VKPNDHEIGRTFFTAINVLDEVETKLMPLASRLQEDIRASVNEVFNLLERQIDNGRIKSEESIVPYGTALRIEGLFQQIRKQLGDRVILDIIWRRRG
jgi:hypothetical protein